MTNATSLRINYLLEDTALFGGVKVPLHHANLMHHRGHEVTVFSLGPRPSWFRVNTPFRTVPGFTADSVPEADPHVATYWTTISPAAGLSSGQAVHYCQGFEASYTHNTRDHPRILEAYAQPLPAFVVSAHLADLLHERFDRPARVVSPALEPFWCARRRRGPETPPRVLVVGPFEIDWKGVATALEAIKLIRDGGIDVWLVRISQWPLGDKEQDLLAPNEFHHHLEPKAVAKVVAGCDLVLAPSWEQEGFGLPVLEAMACGVPVVGSRISSFLNFAEGAAELVPAHDAQAFADAAREILVDRRRWRRMRRAGLDVASDFSERKTSRALESAFRWAASGEWRRHS